jgi:hypothetical protein
MPGLALLVAAEITIISAALRRRGRRSPSTAGGPVGALAVLLLAVIGAPDQLTIRGTTGHDEDLRGVAAYLHENARAGDAVVFVPVHLRDVNAVYPHSFAVLDDVALRQTPVDSGTLHGVEVSAAGLPPRLATRTRVWLVTGDFLATSATEQETHAAKLTVLRTSFQQTSRAEVAAFRILLFEARP